MNRMFGKRMQRCQAWAAGSRRRGMTLVETTVSVGIFAFIIGFVGYLIFMASINAYNVHEQVMSQNSASITTEKLASLLRDATSFVMHPNDVPTTTSVAAPEYLSRILFTVPPLETPSTTLTTSALCFKPPSNGKKGEVWYFRDASNLTFPGGVPSGTPTQRFSNLQEFSIHLESDFRLQLTVGYEYRGFAMVFVRPEVPMAGRFTTDVIARNHFMSYGPHGRPYEYAYDESLTSSPVTL